MQSAESASDTSENSTENTYQNNNQTLNYLNDLIAESLQIYELENQKINIIEEVYNSLKIVTEFLKFSINLYPEIFNLPSDTSILFTPNLDIVIRKSNGKTTTKSLREFSPEIITKILEFIVPHLLGMIRTEKEDLTNKIAFLRNVTKQLKEMHLLQENTTITNEVEI